MHVHISEVQIGDIIGEEIFNSSGVLLVAKNSKLMQDDIQRLKQHHISYINIAQSAQQNEPILQNEFLNRNIEHIKPYFNNAVSSLKEQFEQASAGKKIDTTRIDEHFNPFIDNLHDQSDVVSLLLSLSIQDNYTFEHSVQVGMISYYIAKWLDKSEEEALHIAKAGSLHDIGKSQIDPAILQKPSRLTDAEYNIIKTHTIKGYEILRNSGSDESISLAAAQHHERLNGKGYPYGLSSDQIHPISKIIAVADVYSAMISKRVYQKERDLLVVLKELHSMSFSELDPMITHQFIGRMVPNFIGKKVTLNTGAEGIIVYNNPTDIFNPLVRVDYEFIDLSRQPLEIERIYC